jgi:hypothetical protein
LIVTGPGGKGAFGKGLVGKGSIGKGLIGKGATGKGLIGKGATGKGLIGKGAIVIGKGLIGKGSIGKGIAGKGALAPRAPVPAHVAPNGESDSNRSPQAAAWSADQVSAPAAAELTAFASTVARGNPSL